VREIVREHDFVDGVCHWCGGRQSNLAANLLTCIPRHAEATPRSVPVSIFSDLGSIGDRMREIQAQEHPITPGDEK